MRLFKLENFLWVLILLGLSAPSLAINYTVLNTNDSGADSLRAAILAANLSPSDDTITFATSANGTINLQSELTIANNGMLTISGNGATNTTLSGDSNNDGTGNVRVLSVSTDANLTLDQLTVTKGYVLLDGAGINNSGTLTINNSIISSNNAYNQGGGIFNGGSLTLNYSTISSNDSNSGGGGIYNGSVLTVNHSIINGNTANSSYGGGILSVSPVVVSDSLISGNSASQGGGVFSGNMLTVNNSTISGNHASVNGGGMYNSNTLIVSHSSISGNSTDNTGSAIFNGEMKTVNIDNSIFSGNSAGGVLLNDRGTATLSNSTFSGNSSASLIVFGGTLTLNNSIIANSSSGEECLQASSSIYARNSLIEGSLACVNGIGSSNNLTSDPALNADLTLQTSSPAINAGDNSLIPGSINTDLAGNTRIQNGTVDMGAYELTPAVTLSISSSSITEGGSTAFTLTRDGSTIGALTVNLAITLGAGTTTGDYTLSDSGASLSAQSGNASVTIPAGSSSVTVTLVATDDALDESDETLTLTLLDDVSYDLDTSSSATVTLIDNDSATGIPTLSEWALLLLATLMLGVGAHAVMRRPM